MAPSASLTDGELRTDEFAANTVLWTLNAAKFLDGSFNSPPFTVDDASFRFSIHKNCSQEVQLDVDAADGRGSYFIWCALYTSGGERLLDFRKHVIFSKRLCKLADVGHCDVLRTRIGSSRLVYLLATLFPLSDLEQRNICKCDHKVHTSMDEHSRGELEQTPKPGVTAHWDVTMCGSTGWWPAQRSTLFYVGGDSFQMRIYVTDDSPPSIRLCLERTGVGKEKYFAWFRYWYPNDEGKSELFFVPRIQFPDDGFRECFRTEFGSEYFAPVRSDSGVHVKITCSLLLDTNCKWRVGPCARGQDELQPVLRDFKELLLTGQDSDVIVEVGGEQFQAHKAILGIRCPFFANMFKQDMVEKNTGVVKIPDHTAEEFKHFLIYLYTGRVESVTPKKTLSLYRAADQYGVPDLKADCLRFMKRNLSADTLGDVLDFSLKYDEKQLIHLAKQFFMDNAQAVRKTEGWKQFFKNNFDVAYDMHMKIMTPKAKKQKL